MAGDSIKHIDIIMDVEKHRGCLFTPTDLDNLTNVRDFVMQISQHMTAKTSA